MAPTPGKVRMDLMSFLAIWFENLRKNIFKVEVTNHPTANNQLEAKLEEVVKSVNRLASSDLSVSVINQRDFDTASLTAKLDTVATAVRAIPELDNSSLIAAINALKPKAISKVEVTNQKDTKVSFPKKMDVGGKVEVTNLPKKQKVEGSVSLENIDTIVKGLQVVVESIEELDLSFQNEFKGFSNVVATPMGSRAALKIWDGTDPATLTTVGSDTGLDVNIIGGSSSNTEYTEGDTGASLIGVMAMAEGPSNTVTPLQVDAAKLLQVDIAADSAGIGGGTQYTEDDASAGGETGTLTLAVRDDTPSAHTSTDGDYAYLTVGQYNDLWVSLATKIDKTNDSILIYANTVKDGSGTDYVPLLDSDAHLQVDVLSGGGAGTEYTEDVATANPQVGTATMIERDDALTTVTPIEGDWIGLRGSAEGALWTQDFNSDAILADTAAMVVDLAALEVLLTTIDSDTNTIQSDTTAILADTAAMVIDLAAIEVTQNTIAGAISAGQMQVDIVADGADLLTNTNFAAAFGTAGAADAQVLSVQGIASMTPLSVTESSPLTGFATSAKQLADGHNVTVDNVGGLEVVQATAADLNVTEASAAGILADTTAILADTAAIQTAVEKLDDITGAIKGPGEPTIDSVTHLAINLGAAANQTLVSSAADKQIWVYAVAYTVSVDGTVSFQDEDDAAITGIMDHAANSGLAMGPSGNFSMPIWKLATNKDLEVDVVTAAIDGFITYAIVSV